MEFTHGKILPTIMETEVQESFIDYAMSVITSRALPDVRDGLKPVHRRILYSLYKNGMTPDKKHKKSAHIVGDVLAKYHPHGDSSVYDAMVRLAQDFNIRYPLVDGQGNFGSVDGDSAAAMRYTEARMTKLTLEMLADLEKETVDFGLNYDESEKEPLVLPSRYPNLIVNGSSGIAVGMATNIPPHNLGEVIDGTIALIDNRDLPDQDLLKYVKGPDFPGGGIILGRKGIEDAYLTGRGSIKVRSRSEIEPMNNGKNRIVVTEIPYQVNKARLIEKIAELARDKKIDGITDLRDESDRKGMRIVIELRRDVNPQVILNQLYKNTQLQDNFGVIMLALVDGMPKILTLKQALNHYIDHQEDVVTRRTKHDLRKAEERAHIVEGLKIAVDNIDEVIKIIRSSYNDAESKERLNQRFGLSDRQAQAVIEMQIRRLTGLAREKLEEELADLYEKIAYYKSILADETKLLGIIKDELLQIKEKHNDVRRSQISSHEDKLELEDLIEDEDVVITISHTGYIKRMPSDTYKSQKRGGRGITAMTTKEEDFVEQIFTTSTHNFLIFFTNKGKCYRLKVYEIPEAGRQAKGTAIVNLLNITGDEKITTVIPLKKFDDELFLMAATKMGVVKKTPLAEYDTSRRDGIIAINLEDHDELIGVQLTDGKQDMILVTAGGQAIRFAEEEARPMARATKGVRGIKLMDDDYVVGMEVVRDEGDLLVITANGYGKRTPMEEYRQQARGGKGVFTVRPSARNGEIVGALVVKDDEEIMAISKEGIIIRIKVAEISTMGRTTQGVTIMKMGDHDSVVSMARVAEHEHEEKEQKLFDEE
ncbi:MAG: DNA gyrase subunit A [Peptococcaceae bacterium]|nr:DNA gyrase subunit A [Peptococcaceae bacterium]MBQ2014026.1 DNA gyrase subunit A [Peptococcaceae bacterium]MBQ5652348.1 DNA gyrase subunit A [Peptococcaceae bacterium]MBQ5682441.1 DNA gyrase subunit A [Peptococcaceae bacterium]MBQ5857664.1 DNA gyrase subunit A [Peptococcaceae bacterium]